MRLLIVAILAQALCPGTPVPGALAASRPAAPAQGDAPVSLPDGALPAQALGQAASLSAAVDRSRVQGALNSGQFMFIENVGQWDARARFQVRGAGIFVTDNALWLALREPGEPVTPTRGVHLRLSFPGANPMARAEGFDRLDTIVSFFSGTAAQWHTAVPVWAGVRYADLYPGIDLEMWGQGGQLAWRLVARDATHLADVRLRVQGARALRVAGADLTVDTLVGEYLLPLLAVTGPVQPPAATPHVQGDEILDPFVSSGASLLRGAALDNPLSTQAFFRGTYLGTPSVNVDDRIYDVAVDPDANVYVTGATVSYMDFPAAPGGYVNYYGTDANSYDVFVHKFDPALAHLVYSAILRSPSGGQEQGYVLEVDPVTRRAYVGGTLGFASSGFPVTSDGLTSPRTGQLITTVRGGSDGFISVRNAAGDGLDYSTYLGGGGGGDTVLALAVDDEGKIYATGKTYSYEAANQDPFPTTRYGGEDIDFCNGGAPTGIGNAYMVKLDPDTSSPGSSLLYGTHFGGTPCRNTYGTGISVDAGHSVYLAGSTQGSLPVAPISYTRVYTGPAYDAFVAVFRPATGRAHSLSYSSYLGSPSPGVDLAAAVAVDAEGMAYVVGATNSTAFPTTAGVYSRTLAGQTDLFVAKLDTTQQGASGLKYSTFIGGRSWDYPGPGTGSDPAAFHGNTIAVDAVGRAYVTGKTDSTDFPINRPGAPPAFSGNQAWSDAFIAVLAPNAGALVYSTYVGGNGDDWGNGIAVQVPGLIHLAGYTTSTDFPTHPQAFQALDPYAGNDGFAFALAVPELLDESILTLCQSIKGTLPGDSRSCCLFCGNDGNLYVVGDPVNTRTGAVDYTAVDLSFPALGGQLAFQRSYSSSPLAVDVYTTTLGYGWTHNHDIRLITEDQTELGGEAGMVKFKGQGASRYRFYRNVLTDTFTAGPGLQAELVRSAGGYVLTTTQQMVYTFNAEGRLLTWANAQGHTWTYTYDDYAPPRLVRVADESGGRYVDFHYALSSTQLISVTDPLARAVQFGYDLGTGDLISVTYPHGPQGTVTWTYTYDAAHRLTGVYDPDGNPVQGLDYDAQGRVIAEYDGLGQQTLAIDYQGAAPGAIAGTRVITHAPDGAAWRPVTITYDVRGTLRNVQDTPVYSTTKLFDGTFRPERITDQNGHATEAAWSGDGADLLRTVDARGHVTEMAYDARHQLTRTVQAGLITTTYTYSGTLLTGRAVVGAGPGWQYAYDARGLLIRTTDPLSHSTEYAYDDWGNRVVVTDALGHVTRYAYDAVGRLITTTDALGHMTVNAYDDQDHPLQVTRNYTITQADPAQYNLVTRYAYDVRGQQVLVTDTLGHVTRTEYDGAGRAVTVTQNYSAALPLRYLNQYNLLTVTQYNAAGRPADVVRNYVDGEYDRAHPDEDVRAHTEYDAQGRAIAQVQNYVDGTFDPAHPDEDVRTTSGYDPVGNTITQTDALGHVTRTWYDELNRPISVTQNYTPTHPTQNYLDQYNLVTWYAYDALGRVLTQTDTAGRVTQTGYDALGRVVQVTQNYTTTQADPNQYNLVTLTAYDAAGNVVSRTDTLGHVMHTEYDALSHPVTVTQNYRPGYAQNYLNQYNLVMVTAYDALGHRVAMTDTLGHVTEYMPDALGRVVTVTRYLTESAQPPVGTPVLEVTHYDALGRRVKTFDPLGHAVEYGYDALGRTTIVTDATGYTHTTAYNALGWVMAQYDGLGRATSFTYDGLGRQLSVTDPLSHSTSYVYDAAGRRVSMTDANGMVMHYDYDALGRRVQIIENYQAGQGRDAETNVATRYVYDALGNPTAMVNSRGYTTTYTYDALSRRVTTRNPLGHAEHVQYDAVGHRTVFTDANQAVAQYAYDAAGRLMSLTYVSDTTTVAYDYDALGRRMAMTDTLGTTEYSYDSLDRLTGVKNPYGLTVKYAYDLAGNRTWVAYPDDQEVHYTHDAANRLVAVRDWSEQTTSYGYDRAGRLVTTTLPNGVVTVNAYDLAGHLVGRFHAHGTDVLGQYIFESDNLGNTRAVTETLLQPTGATITDTATYGIAASTDDASVHQVGDGSWTTTTTGNTLPVGQDGVPASVTDVAGLRFTGIDLPTGAAVTQAVLNVTASGVPGQAGTTQMQVYGEAADAAAAYSTSENFAWRELTTAAANWGIAPWTAGASYQVDVTGVVSEVVARPGWTDGNPVALQLASEITGTVQPWSFDGSVTRTARLTVTYTGPVMEPATTTLRYTYDPLQRVTDVTARGSYSATWGYVYDEMGNRTSYTSSITSTVVTTYTYNAANQLVTARATSDNIMWYYRHDPHGSLVEVTPNGQTPAGGALRYTYNQAYQLVAVERYSGGAYQAQASMSYDGGGHRLALTAWHGSFGVTAHYTVDDWAQGAVLTATTGTQSTYYLYGADGVFAEQTATWGYYLKDGQATVRQMAGARGVVTLMRRYDPFGEVLERHGSGTLAWGYFGGLLDAATGLLYLGNGLYYDPATGRLLTPAGPGPNPYLPYAPGSADPLGAMLGPLALVALVAMRRRRRGNGSGAVDRLLILAAVLLVIGTGLVACTPAPNQQPTGTGSNPPGTPAGSPTGTQQAPPTSTPTPTPTPTATATATITPCPTPTSTPMPTGMVLPPGYPPPTITDALLQEAWLWLWNAPSGKGFAEFIVNGAIRVLWDSQSPVPQGRSHTDRECHSDTGQCLVIGPIYVRDWVQSLPANQKQAIAASEMGHEAYHYTQQFGPVNDSLLEEYLAFEHQDKIERDLAKWSGGATFGHTFPANYKSLAGLKQWFIANRLGDYVQMADQGLISYYPPGYPSTP